MLFNEMVIPAAAIAAVSLGMLYGAPPEARADPAPWAEARTVADFCEHWPKRARALLDALDLERAELAEVRKAAERDDLVEACEALLASYRDGKTGQWLRTVNASPSEHRREQAEALLNDTFTFYGQTDLAPRGEDGRLDWNHAGPSGDREWPLALNRHQFLRTLLHAYVARDDKRYVQYIDALLRDWVVANAPYPEKRNANLPWRGLEISFRAKHWAAVFYALQDDEHFRPATRLLMLSDLPHHAHHLRHFHAGGNWMTMELSGLAMIAAAWPQFKDSRKWMDYAKQTLLDELKRQVYPDGVQKELTSSYHWVALSNFEQLAEVCRASGEPLDDSYADRLADMYAYLAYVMRPDGGNVLNNDSNRSDFGPRVRRAAETYDRPDWRYIATNGQEGEAPERGPSILFPWAGQLISRSGWDTDAHWSFFDVGPWGTGHQHNDKLHISIHAHGRDLLVDTGRFAYDGEIARRFRASYARHTRGHNALLIDGRGQSAGPRETDTPLDEQQVRITDGWDFARANFDDFEDTDGKAQHQRAMLYLRGEYWIIVDRVTTDRPRKVTALWHFHPDCTVELDKPTGGAVTTGADLGNLRVVPAVGDDWEMRLVRGQDEPHPQGWYSREYNSFVESTALVADAGVDGDRVFAWLLLSAKGEVPSASLAYVKQEAGSVTLRVRVGDKTRHIVIPLTGKGEPSAE